MATAELDMTDFEAVDLLPSPDVEVDNFEPVDAATIDAAAEAMGSNTAPESLADPQEQPEHPPSQSAEPATTTAVETTVEPSVVSNIETTPAKQEVCTTQTADPQVVNVQVVPETPEQQRERQIREAEREFCEASIRFRRLNEMLKAAKDMLKAAEDRLASLANYDLDDLDELEDEDWQPALTSPVTMESVAKANDSKPAPAATPSVALDPNDPDAWKKVPTSELKLETIKGMGEKLRETIYEICPTIGELEALRAKGSGKGIGLRSIKGLGEAKADAIQDKILSWLSANRDQAVLANAAAMACSGEAVMEPVALSDEQPAEPEAAGDDEPEAAEAPAAESETTEPETTEPEAAEPKATDESEPAWLAEIDDEEDFDFEAAAARLKGESLEHQHSPSAWHSGHEAFYKGWPLNDCPYTAELRDDYIRGWLTAQEKYGDQPAPSDKSAPAEEPAAEPDPYASLDADEDQRQEWEKALALCEQIVSLAHNIPDRGEDFAQSVIEKTEDIAAGIEEKQRVTAKQMEALQNMLTGVEAWQPA